MADWKIDFLLCTALWLWLSHLVLIQTKERKYLTEREVLWKPTKMSEILQFKLVEVDRVSSSGNLASALFLVAQRDFITTTLTPLTAGSPRRLQQITPLTGSRSRELCSEKLVTETFSFIPPNVHIPQRNKRDFFWMCFSWTFYTFVLAPCKVDSLFYN